MHTIGIYINHVYDSPIPNMPLAIYCISIPQGALMCNIDEIAK